MSHDGIGVLNLEHQPLTPLNTFHKRNNGLKAHKAHKVKETKPAMEVCDVKITNVTMDLELAGQLASTAIDQFLFFMNQVPFPVSRLANAPATNDKAARLRSDFMAAHTRLLNDVKSALGFVPDAGEGSAAPPFRIILTLGGIMMPKAAMLFQMPAVQGDYAMSPTLLAPTASPIRKKDPTAPIVIGNELPPDSDSDQDDSSDTDTDPVNPSTTPQTSIKRVPPTPSVRPPFTPFSDSDTINNSTSVTQLASLAPTSQLRLSQSIPSRPSVSRAVPPSFSSEFHPISDENQTSKLRLEKRLKAAERELTVALSNLELFTEETELSKVHVYLQAPRSYTGIGWHPRPSATKTLDSLAKFPHVDGLAKSKLAKMNACAIRVTLTDGEIIAANLSDAEESVWLEWDAKLAGVE